MPGTSHPITINQIASALERTHWAHDVGLDALATFARFCEPRSLNEGAFVFRQGDTARFLCTLTHGRIEILKQNSGEELRLLSTVSSGKSFGEMALLDHEPRSASARAATASELLVLSEEKFEELATGYPRLGIRIVQALARLLSGRLRMTSGQLVDYL